MVQFLTDNCSWIYLDGDHELSFIIFDGGGAAGGKFRLETTQSFIDNGGDTGVVVPPSNTAPVADAGSDASVEATGATPSLTLGLGSHTFTLTVDHGKGAGVNITVTSNETANGLGDGNTSFDHQLVTNADGTFNVFVRAERSGNNSGRVYTITMSSTDASGNTATESFTATVAQNQGRASR